MIGRRIAHYKILDVLGEGGMGIVYKALDLQLERYVAIKILNSHALNNPQFVERFKREAKNQAKLNHPNIVPVFGFTEEKQVLGIVMEFVDGETLEHLIESKGRLGVLQSLKIVKQILQGAAYAHLKGFVHRDLKPSNIIINKEGVAKIMDFGISKSLNETKGITRIGTKLGTLLYMSPEQIKALEPTHQSDIYSIGITFYEMLTGKNPFDLGTEYQILEAHLKLNPPRLSTMIGSSGSELDSIIARAMNKSTRKRYQSCDDFQSDVDDLIAKLDNTVTKSKLKTASRAVDKKNTDELVKKKNNNIRFFVFAFFFILMFTGLILFIYDAVSALWKTENIEQIESAGLNQNNNSSFNKNVKWKPVNSSTQQQINAIFFLSDSLGFACGLNGTFLKSMDGGLNWTGLIDSTHELSKINFYDVVFVSSTKGFLTGDQGTLLTYNPVTNVFSRINTIATESLFDILFLKNSSIGFIVGANGTILKTDDNGINWYKPAASLQKLLYNVFFINEKVGFIAGWEGTILKSTDGGNNWKILEKFTDKYFRSIFFVDDKLGLVVGGGGEIYRTENGGEEWELIDAGISSGLFNVYFFNERSGLILGSKGEILLSEDSGKSWNSTGSGQYAGLLNLTLTPSNKIFLSGQNGIILTSSN